MEYSKQTIETNQEMFEFIEYLEERNRFKRRLCK